MEDILEDKKLTKRHVVRYFRQARLSNRFDDDKLASEGGLVSWMCFLLS